MSRFAIVLRAAVPAVAVLSVLLGPAGVHAQTTEEHAVRAATERFLAVLGGRQLDALPALFAPKATMTIVRLRDGVWSASSQTADEWLAGLRKQATPTAFAEPLTNVTVHVEDGQLAFLRADFTVVIEGQVRSHGVDYFTLVKDGGAWKIVNASYTSKTGPPRER